jgi:hypothetical protein
MRKRIALPIALLFILTMASCVATQEKAMNDYYKAKKVFIVVAEEAYQYAIQPGTPTQDRELIKSVGLKAFDIIDKIDYGLESYDRGRELLLNAVFQLKAVINKGVK